LTGETVHPSDTDTQLIVLAATRPPRSLGALRPDLEPWLIKVVDRALAFERRARWPNARAMSAALSEPALRAGLISAQPNTALGPSSHETAPEMALTPSRPAPRQRVHGALGWSLALLLLLGVVVSVLAAQHRNGYVPTKTSAVAPPERAPTEVVSGANAPSVARDEGFDGGARPSLSAARPLSSARPPKPHLSAPRPPAARPVQPNNPLFFPAQ